MNYLWVTGMFRSGTTLTAKMMDAHPEVSFASDPYRPYFNDLRDKIASMNGLLKGSKRYTPLNDYFCDDEQLKVMELVQNATLDEAIDPEDLKILKERLKKEAMEFSHFIAENMDELKGTTYRELFGSMMSLVTKYYGKPGAKLVGFKEVWCNEFTGLLIKRFPGIKVINIVRDPRAVCASRNAMPEKYPWLFLIRQWRKLSIFTWLFSSDPELKKSLLVVKYEDIVGEPENTSRRICEFLGISFSESMIDGSKFRDGDGTAWHQNSTYEETGQAITSKFSEKWRSVLSAEEIRLIETLCYHEMKLFGYEPVTSGVERIRDDIIYDPLIIPRENLAEWIKVFSNTDVIHNISEMGKELLRDKLINMEDEELSSLRLDEKLIMALFVDRKYFSHVRKNVKPGVFLKK